LNGLNRKFTLFAGNVATPPLSAVTGAFPVVGSQWSFGNHDGVIVEPSHCSMNTGVPGVYPLATTVKKSGSPAASIAGTLNGFELGVVIDAANATPPSPASAMKLAARSATRRLVPSPMAFQKVPARFTRRLDRE
jgi:hypothetical protein